MGIVGVVVNGVWQTVDDGQHVIDAPISDPVDLIVARLAEVIRLAQSLTPADARRVRDFVVATSATLSATTFLEKSDQRAFERSLRDAAKQG